MSKLLLAVLFGSVMLLSGCAEQPREINKRLDAKMPGKILWAWERPEDLRFIDPKQFGVAYLAQTLYLQNNDVLFRPRRQSLEVLPETYLIAVTRIETAKDAAIRAQLSDEQRERLITFIKRSLERPNVRGIQIDFDVVVSERKFYKNLVIELQKQLAPAITLTVTSLASWCVGDAWFSDFPIDEAVPMIFRMGADAGQVRSFLAAGSDWNEPLCRGSYGISTDEPLNVKFRENRRIYYFNPKAWEKSDVEKLDQ